MNRNSLASLLALCLLAACKIGGSETATAAGGTCIPVAGACAQNADCCSYGCQAGICAANPLEGGTCRTTDDCALYRLCKSAACTTPTASMCRDDADVCSSAYQCCSGNCVGYAYPASGSCRPNHAPVAAFTVSGADANGNVPYHAPLTLLNGSTDADGDTLLYTWAITARPVGSTATLSSPSAASPTFTPDVIGDYAVLLTVVDGPALQPGRLTASAQQVFHAANVPPVVSAGADRIASRNVALAISGTVSDPDGDALTCTWFATPPGGAQAVLAGPGACSGTFGATFLCSGVATEGSWTITLAASDAATTVTSSALVNCVNDPPVANAGANQVWNLGATVAQNPTVPLAGTFTDPNGDAASTWQWTLQTVPPGSALVPGTLSSAQTASFVPDVAGAYVAQVQVCDRPSSCGSATTTVSVYPRIHDLGHAADAAAYAKTAERIAIAAVDPTDATKGRVWLLDPASGNEVYAQLDAVPTTVAVSPDGGTAIAANALWFWIVKFGASTTVTRIASTAGDPNALALAGSNAFVFPKAVAYNSYVNAVDVGAGSPAMTVTTQTGHVGRSSAAGTQLYVLDAYWNELDRYTIGKQGGSINLTPVNWVPSVYCSDLWTSLDTTHVFTSCGDIYVIGSSTLTYGASLGVAPVHMDSSAAGTYGAVALDSTRRTVDRFTSLLAAAGSDAVPLWGVSGTGYTAYGDFVFLKSDGTARYALIHASANGSLHYGLVTFP